MRSSSSFQDVDWLLLGLALAVAIIGVVEIYSTTAHTVLASQYKRQIYWIIVGCILALVMSQIDYHLILEQTPWLYICSILVLTALLLAGRSIAGTRRWLHIGGGMTFQVSELV
jgi:rod shape determining protein RodA